MSRRILVLTASVGAGHLRAAEAVELALRQLDPAAEVSRHDVLDFTNALFRRVYGQAYLDLVNKLPHALGYFYDLLDRPPSPQQKTDRIRRIVERLNLSKFLRFLQSRAWDVIVHTHFLSAEMVALLRRECRLDTPHMTVTTDFDTHRLWVNEPCERYFTATEEGARYLQYWGVPVEATCVTGIPIHPAFSGVADRAACLARHGLFGDRPIVLQLAGGFGVGPVEQIYRTILSVPTPLEVVVVCGRNEELRGRLAEQPVPPDQRAHVLGFTEAMHELMSVADLVVSKPGGLTSSEILASGAALVIVNPIPGQESRNSDYLLESGAAVKVNHSAALAYKLEALLRDPARIAALRGAARRIGRPRAAFEVARQALAWPSQTGAESPGAAAMETPVGSS